MFRNTYVEIYLDNIKYNIKKVIELKKEYKYYFGVVKADCYGHGNEVVKTIIESGCNYLVDSLLNENLEIIKKYDIPILCLGIINQKYLDICLKNNITITIPSFNYLKNINNLDNLKVHVKIDTGMNRLGIKSNDELKEVLKLIDEKNMYLEGIYTHLYKTNDEKITKKQFLKFEEIIKDINAPIIHISASEGTIKYEKKEKVNGCRLGICMYGLDDTLLKYKDTFKLYSEIIDIKEVKKNETIGYNATYKASKDMKIGIVSIGYGDGVLRKYKGNKVYINDKPYLIVGNICMDMLMVKIDDKVKINDKVLILKDIKHIKETAKYLDTIPYEIICTIGKRVPRIYKKTSNY